MVDYNAAYTRVWIRLNGSKQMLDVAASLIIEAIEARDSNKLAHATQLCKDCTSTFASAVAEAKGLCAPSNSPLPLSLSQINWVPPW